VIEMQFVNTKSLDNQKKKNSTETEYALFIGQ